MEKKDFGIILVFIVLFIILCFIYLIRNFSIKELDDLTPGIKCDEKLLNKADIYWVIPLHDNKSIAQDKEWCEYILSFNKEIGMHGVYHTFNEFAVFRDESYLNQGISEFERCFGFKPEKFKSPQMAMFSGNMTNLKEVDLKNRGMLSQIFHKVYHCSDTGKFSNRFNDLF